MTHVPSRPAQSTIAVELIRHEWMVVQRMTAEDAREVAWAFGDDGVYRELMEAAADADRMNQETE